MQVGDAVYSKVQFGTENYFFVTGKVIRITPSGRLHVELDENNEIIKCGKLNLWKHRFSKKYQQEFHLYQGQKLEDYKPNY